LTAGRGEASKFEEETMTEKESPDYEALKIKVEALAKGPGNRPAIEARLKELSQYGIPTKKLDPNEVIGKKEQILDRVQMRAEEYEQVSQSCAKSSALAVMEEFGFGDIKVITALSPFPGIALTGETCGAVSGGMTALALYFGKDDLLAFEANARLYGKCRKLIKRFEQALGTTKCREIHQNVIFGRYYETADIAEGYPGFLSDKGFEKCGLPPGIGARIAADIIIQDLEKKS
jgi:C_GCAxxG_C_C family probable redox protein